jgi:hypothetical protein
MIIPTVMIHHSVIERLKQNREYRPINIPNEEVTCEKVSDRELIGTWRIGVSDFAAFIARRIEGAVVHLTQVASSKRNHSLQLKRTVSLVADNSRGIIQSREVLGNYRGQSQQSRMELGLRVSVGLQRTNNLDC